MAQNDYIDPFGGNDYINPDTNAGKLSTDVDHRHALREAREQQRYASPQKPRKDPEAQPEKDTAKHSRNVQSKDFGNDSEGEAKAGRRGEDFLNGTDDEFPNESDEDLGKDLEPSDASETMPLQERSLTELLLMVWIGPLVLIAVFVFILGLSRSGPGTLPERFDNLVYSVKMRTDNYSKYAQHETTYEHAGNLYGYDNGRGLHVSIANVRIGPQTSDKDDTIAVTYDCENISIKTFAPGKEMVPFVAQNGVELTKTTVPGATTQDLYGDELKPRESSRRVVYYLLPKSDAPITVLVSNTLFANTVRSAFALDTIGTERSTGTRLKCIAYTSVPKPAQVDKSAFHEDGTVSSMHFHIGSMSKLHDSKGNPVAMVRIPWYFDDPYKPYDHYNHFAQYAYVKASQNGRELDCVLWHDPHAENGVQTTSVFAFQLSDERSPVTFTITADDQLSMRRSFDPSVDSID